MEKKTDWSELMTIVGEGFDTSDDIDTLKRNLETKIVEWLKTYETGTALVYNIDVKIEEIFSFDKDLGGRMKYVSAHFNDGLKTVLAFFVTRSRRLATLRDIACEALADLVKKDEDVENLDIPQSVLDDVVKSSNDPWTERGRRRTLEKKNATVRFI